jgi:hypothetical protein
VYYMMNYQAYVQSPNPAALAAGFLGVMVVVNVVASVSPQAMLDNRRGHIGSCHPACWGFGQGDSRWRFSNASATVHSQGWGDPVSRWGLSALYLCMCVCGVVRRP